MPIDGPDHYTGCYSCFNESEDASPHSNRVQNIVQSIEGSDIIIINSPTYCLSMTGQLKTFLDLLGYMWISHRPKKLVFLAIGIVISTSTGVGARKVIKDLKQQMFWLGISNFFRYHKNANASNWKSVPDKIKTSIVEDVHKLSIKIKFKDKNVRPSLKFKFIFEIMRKSQKLNDWNLTDKNHWKENEWIK